MSKEEVRKLATGLTFTGTKSVENGLADEVGTLEDAEKKAAELAGISNYQVVNLFLPQTDLIDFVSVLGEARPSADEIAAAILDRSRTQVE